MSTTPASPFGPSNATALGESLARIAWEAGLLIMPLWRSDLDVETKLDSSPVTIADRRAETFILAELAKLYPDVPVISEEHASDNGVPEQIAERFFLVDPLDGTKAFVRGDPSFTVNIGLIEGGAPAAGAVVAPASGETWLTTSNGAVKLGPVEGPRRVFARAWPQGAAVALISHTMKPDTLVALREQYRFDQTQAMDSSIKLCRIAEGGADIYPRHGPTMEWDIAAAHAVLAAAGGRLTGVNGSPFTYGKAETGFRNPGFVARGA